MKAGKNNRAPQEIWDLISKSLHTSKPRRYGRLFAMRHDGVDYKFRAERVWIVRQVSPPYGQPEKYVYFYEDVKRVQK